MKNQTTLNIAEQLRSKFSNSPLYLNVIDDLENTIESITPHAGVDVWVEALNMIIDNGVSIMPKMAAEENIMDFVGKHAYEITSLLNKLNFEKSMGAKGFKQMAYISYKFVCEDIADELFEIKFPYILSW